VALAMLPSGFIAVLAGWATTEVGRQPYTIYGLLTTAQSASPIAAPAVAASLLAFIVIYFSVFGAGTYYIYRMARSRPDHPNPDIKPGPIHAAGITPGPTLELAKGGAS
jgi:cytochrome bd ubiquinol oxidase subunit I